MSQETIGYTPLLIPEIPQVRNIDELQQKIDESGTSLLCLSFISCWCHPCRYISTKFVELMEKFPNLGFIMIDIDDCGGLHGVFNITMVPTFILIKDKNIIEVFVGNSYRRLLRRLQLQFEEDEEKHTQIRRICQLLRDEVYMVPLETVTVRYPVTIKRLGLICAERKLAWKNRTQKFIEAFEKAERNHALKIHFGGTDSDKSESPSSSVEDIKTSEKTGASKEDSKETVVDTDSVTTEAGGLCLLDINLEDRLYSRDEVKKLLHQCQLKCFKERRDYERRIKEEKIQKLMSTEQDMNHMSKYFSSTSDEEDLTDYSYSLQKNLNKLEAAREKKAKKSEGEDFKESSSGSDLDAPLKPVTISGKEKKS